MSGKDASGGVAEDDDGRDLVKCCSDRRTEGHREQHDEECKTRAQELHDKQLFRQPDGSHYGECPICFLPMPLDPGKWMFKSCCSNLICYGCVVAHYKSSGGNSCPFCREPLAEDEEKNEKRMMKRIKANDPAAMSRMGSERFLEGDYDTAFEYCTKAAELGDVEAHYSVGCMYGDGEGVEKDEEKKVYHFEQAAIGGHPEARHNLGCYEEDNGNIERAVKHFIIAANLGFELSMKRLWTHYSGGNITKENLEATLRSHKAAIDEMKSSRREEAERFISGE